MASHEPSVQCDLCGREGSWAKGYRFFSMRFVSRDQQAQVSYYDDIRRHDYNDCSDCHRRTIIAWTIAFGAFPLAFFIAGLGLRSVAASVVVLVVWGAAVFVLSPKLPVNHFRRRVLQERRTESGRSSAGSEPIYVVMDHSGFLGWMQTQTEAILVILARGVPDMEGTGRWLLRTIPLRGHQAVDWFGERTAFGVLTDARAADPNAHADLAAQHLRDLLGPAYSPERVEVVRWTKPDHVPAVVAVQWRGLFSYFGAPQKATAL